MRAWKCLVLLGLLGAGANLAVAQTYSGTCSINASPSTYVSPGTPVTLSPNCQPSLPNGTQYLWSTGETTPTITVYPTHATTYSLTVTPPSPASPVLSSVTISTGCTTLYLSVSSGSGQTGAVGTALTNDFVVHVQQNLNFSSSVLVDVPDGTNITWSITSTGGGTLSAGLSTTSSGLARTKLTLGANTGTYTVNADASCANLPATFSATAVLPVITIASGDNQTGTVNTQLFSPLVVNVTAAGSPVPNGTAVTWAVTSGNGTLSTLTTTFTNNGQASNMLTLGPNAGTQTVTATVAGGGSVIFSALANPPPASIAILSGNNQTGTPGAPLGNPLVVSVTQGGSPAPNGTSVTWNVTAGGGTLSAGVTTITGGQTSNTLTLGPSAGAQTVTASVAVGGLVTSVTFTANVALPIVAIVSGNNQTGAPNTPLGSPFIVSVTQGGSPAPNGTSVAWNVTAGGGTLSAGVTTVTGGQTSNTLTLGPSAGAQTVTASVAVGGSVTSVTFTANLALPLVAIVSGNNQTGAPNKPLGSPFIVSVTQGGAAVADGTSVTWNVTAGGGTLSAAVTSTTAGQASNTLTLGPSAGAQTVTASVAVGNSVTSVTFAANVVLPIVAIVSGNNQTSAPNKPLGSPFIVSVTQGGAAAADGTSVTWNVTAGGGALSAAVTSTTAGQTSNTLTVGPNGGPQTVTASVIGGSTVTFSAAVETTTCTISPPPSNIVQGTSISLTVTCSTPTGTPVTPTSFAWSSNPQSGNLQGATTATVTDTPSTNATYTYTVKVTLPSGFIVTSTSSPTSVNSGKLTIVSGDGQPALANSTITLKVRATNPTKTDNSGIAVPAAGVMVTWQAGPGDTLAQSDDNHRVGRGRHQHRETRARAWSHERSGHQYLAERRSPSRSKARKCRSLNPRSH